MLDQFDREINYLRISLTDRCNLRCRYCCPEEPQKLEHTDVLSYEEILRLCHIAVALGFQNFKITGGEPLLRKGCLAFLRRLKNLPGVAQVTLTTNGTLLAAAANELADLGLDGVNVSLDSLNPKRYAALTGCALLAQVLAGITAARRASLYVKLNCVLAADLSEADLRELLSFASQEELPLRFIELMPLVCNGKLSSISGRQLRLCLRQMGYDLQPLLQTKFGNGPAVYYQLSAQDGRQCIVGFIEALHGRFCSSCNRLRLMATGLCKNCLYHPAALDCKKMLRTGATDAQLTAALAQAVYSKPLAHQFLTAAPTFTMKEIGG